MNIKINTTCNYRKSVVLKIQLKMCKHPELVKSVAAAWGTGAQVNLNGWGLISLISIRKMVPPLEAFSVSDAFRALWGGATRTLSDAWGLMG